MGGYRSISEVEARWLLNGIVAPGQRLPGMVGNEYSQVDLSVPTQDVRGHVKVPICGQL
jgi:hypothetical protein